MEIENNLISFSDVNSVSAIKSVNQRMILLYVPYKQAMNMTSTQENISNGIMYNMVTNRQLKLDSEKVIELFEYIHEYQEQSMPKDPSSNSTQMFLPLVEVPQKWSCPRFIIRLPGAIANAGTTYYHIRDDLKFLKENISSGMSCQFASFLKDLSYCDEFEMHVAYMFRAKNLRDLDLKIHFLDVLMSPVGARKFVEKCQRYISSCFQKTYPDMKFISETYNEIGITNCNPRGKRWDVLKIIKTGYSDNISAGQVIDVKTFLSDNKPNPAVFSVNDYKVGKFKKARYSTEYDDEVVEFRSEDNTELMQLIHADPDARYYSIVLDHLPENYRTNKQDWIGVVMGFRDQLKYRVLLEDFSKKTPFGSEFLKYWYSHDGYDVIPRGFLYQECLKVEGFRDTIFNFYKSYLEISLYETQCKITTYMCMTIVSMMYKGLFYMTSEGKHEVWWMYVDRHETIIPGEAYKWRKLECSPYDLSEKLKCDLRELLSNVKTTMEISIRDHPNAKSLVNNLNNSKLKFDEPIAYHKVVDMLKSRVFRTNFQNILDSYKDVVGTLDGILHLDLTSPDPNPRFITGYSKYYVTKYVRARYIPYDPNNEYVVLWRKIYSDIFIEPDVCQFVWYMLSTGLDQIAKVWKILQIVAGGSNGKSVALDNPLFVLNSYATKLRPEVITARNRPGAADENLMDLKGRNLGIITETNEGDELVSSRIKEITEYEKRSRGMYTKNESFQTNITILLASNFPLVIDEDGGVDRRMLYTVAKSVFRSEPDPENPYEKKVNREYEHLAMTNIDAANALFSILVYERCQLQKLYGSDLDKVPIPTINRETQEYKTSQNRFAYFVCSRLVTIFGYNAEGRRRKNISDEEIESYYTKHCVSIPDKLIVDQIAASFVNWAKKYTDKSWTIEKATQKLHNSRIAKLYINSNELHGHRILGDGEKKLDEEYFFTLY